MTCETRVDTSAVVGRATTTTLPLNASGGQTRFTLSLRLFLGFRVGVPYIYSVSHLLYYFLLASSKDLKGACRQGRRPPGKHSKNERAMRRPRTGTPNGNSRLSCALGGGGSEDETSLLRLARGRLRRLAPWCLVVLDLRSLATWPTRSSAPRSCFLLLLS